MGVYRFENIADSTGLWSKCRLTTPNIYWNYICWSVRYPEWQ